MINMNNNTYLMQYYNIIINLKLNLFHEIKNKCNDVNMF